MADSIGLDQQTLTFIMKVKDEMTAALGAEGRSLDALSAKVTALGANVDRLSARQARSSTELIKNSKALADNTKAIEAASKAGSTLSTSLGSVSSGAKSAATSLASHSNAVKAAAKEHMSLNVLLRETFVLLREGGRGNFSRMAGSASILLTQGFKVPPALLGLGAVIVGAAGAFVYFEDKGSRAFKNVTEAARQMGNSIGLSVGQLNTQANNISTYSTQSIASIRDLQAQGIRGGILSPQVLQQLILSAPNFASMTGQSQTAANKQLVEMIGDPAKGLKELSTTIPTLNAAEYQLVQTMIRNGDVAKAQGVLMDALAAKTEGALTESRGYLERFFDWVADKAHGLVNGIENIGVPDSGGGLNSAIGKLSQPKVTLGGGTALGAGQYGNPADAAYANRNLSPGQSPATSNAERERVLDALQAIVYQLESNSGRNIGVSSKGAIGPMQVEPGTGAAYLKPGENLSDFDTNMRVGRQVLSGLLDKYHNLNDILTAYNAGPGKVGSPNLPDETKNYIARGNALAGAAFSGTGLDSDISAVRREALGQSKAQQDAIDQAATKAAEEATTKFQNTDQQTRTRLEAESILAQVNRGEKAPNVTGEQFAQMEVLRQRAEFMQSTNVSEAQRQAQYDQVQKTAEGMSPKDRDAYLAYQNKKIELLGTLHTAQEVEAAAQSAAAKVTGQQASALKQQNDEMTATVAGLKAEAIGYEQSRAAGLAAAAAAKAHQEALNTPGLDEHARATQILQQGSAESMSSLAQEVQKSKDAADAAVRLATATHQSTAAARAQEIQNRATAATAEAMAHALTMQAGAERDAAVAAVNSQKAQLVKNYTTTDNAGQNDSIMKSIAQRQEQLQIAQDELAAQQSGNKEKMQAVELDKARYEVQQQFPEADAAEVQQLAKISMQLGAAQDQAAKLKEEIKPLQTLTSGLEGAFTSVFDHLLNQGTRNSRQLALVVGNAFRKMADDIANAFVFKPTENFLLSSLFGNDAVKGNGAIGSSGGGGGGLFGASGLLGGLFSKVGDSIFGNSGVDSNTGWSYASMQPWETDATTGWNVADESAWFGNAKGAAFWKGVKMMATGDIVNSPTFMGMSGGRAAVAGEAGPEAVLPLTRDSSGNLGIHAGGMGSAFAPTIVINNNAPGGSPGQNADLARRQQDQFGKTLQAMFTAGVRDQQRPGNMLNPVGGQGGLK